MVRKIASLVDMTRSSPD